MRCWLRSSNGSAWPSASSDRVNRARSFGKVSQQRADLAHSVIQWKLRSIRKECSELRDRRLSFERAIDFDFTTAALAIDTRREYGEVRYVAVGYLDNRLHVMCFTETPSGIRVISFRKANSREIKEA